MLKTINIKFAVGLSIFLSGVFVTSPSNAELSVEFSFVPAEMEAPDERAMKDHLRSAINLHCEFVAFDVSPLETIIDKIADGTLEPSETSVTVRFLDGILLKYIGASSRTDESASETGRYYWEGVASERESFATFSVQPNNRAKAYLSKEGVLFVLYPSNWSSEYFLCMRDPEFRGRSLD